MADYSLYGMFWLLNFPFMQREFKDNLKRLKFEDALSALFSECAYHGWRPEVDGFGPFSEED